MDWELVDRRRSSMLAAQEASPLKLGISLSPESEQRALAEAAWLDGDFARALAMWRKQKAEPEDPTELALMAESLAESGDPAAEALIDRVRELQPLEAQAFRARLRLRQGKVSEAGAALESVLIGYQSDPWPMPLVMGRALRLALDVAGKDRPFAERLFRLLERPFAVNLLDEVRKQTRVSLAKLVGFERLCVEAFSAFEPNVLWDRNFLTDRVRCYASRRHPAADAAQRDLTTFIAQDRRAFSTGLLPAGGSMP